MKTLKKFFLIVFFAMLSGCAGAQTAPTAPGVATPTPLPTCTAAGVTEAIRIDSPEQGFPYDAKIHLPPCYDPQSEYPVLYLIPGRSSNPSTWLESGAERIADGMIDAGEIPPFIIVSTSNTDEDADALAIQNDLMPWVEAHYPVKEERRFHAVAGGSLGGIAVYRIVLSRPGRYSSAGIFGSGAVSMEDPRIHAWLAAIPESQKPRFFLNCGFEDEYMLARARALIEMLDAYTIPHTEIFTAGDHSYAYWSGQLRDYFFWMAQDWR